jgi:ascorbate-specific PTS system EIIC-type component UlaA
VTELIIVLEGRVEPRELEKKMNRSNVSVTLTVLCLFVVLCIAFLFANVANGPEEHPGKVRAYSNVHLN